MTGLAVPASLDWLRGHEAGRSWLSALPGLVAGCAQYWSLRLGEPFPDSYVSIVIPARLPDGSDTVLKVQFPEPDSRHEAAALRLLGGSGAIRLLAHDEDRLAMLIERCVPGAPLSTVPPDEALTVLIGLLPRTWRPPAAPFATAETEADRWIARLDSRWVATGRPCERSLVDAAVDAFRGLSGTQGEQVLLNQDLHVNNVLRAGREPWLVTDPKPLVGERELAVACLVRDYGLGHSRYAVRGRLDRLTAELGVDRERARGWSLAKAVLWAFQDEEGMTRHFETARWLRD
jgi:streptomycin 6-kinase